MPPDINALIQKYFVQPDDAVPPSEPVPATFANCLVTPLIDGAAYFAELSAQLAALGNGTPAENGRQFIYIAGWWLHLMGGDVIPAPGASGDAIGPTLDLGKPFSLDGPGRPTRLIDVLKAKAQAGVDVRVLGWISWAVMGSNMGLRYGASIQSINGGTLATIAELRKEPKLAKKACLNTIGHTAGAPHTKMVIVGSDTSNVGFTGGIDLVGDRHTPKTGSHTIDLFWHDVQAKVEGPAVQALYDLFRAMWNELIARPPKTFRFGSDTLLNYTPGTLIVPDTPLMISGGGKHRVQSLRTIPRFNYVLFNNLPENPPISFAPNGLFEARAAWRKAILAAEKYIYIEDQSYWSTEIMDWINESIRNHNDLKVIFVRGSKTDPTDPILPPFTTIAMVNHLVKGLTQAQKDRIGIFDRSLVFVHSKTTLIDDHWTIIGSTNFTRRSLYSDIEHSLAVLDEDDMMVQQYRTQLWGEHFGLSSAADRAKLNDIDKALNVWKPAWGTAGSGITLPATLVLMPLPTTAPTLSSEEQEKYDRYYDLDSREDWGGCLP